MGLRAYLNAKGGDKMKIILNDSFYTYFFIIFFLLKTTLTDVHAIKYD